MRLLLELLVAAGLILAGWNIPFAERLHLKAAPEPQQVAATAEGPPAANTEDGSPIPTPTPTPTPTPGAWMWEVQTPLDRPRAE